MYDFKFLISLNLIIGVLDILSFSVHIKMKEAIIFIIITMKEYYDKKYTLKLFSSENKITLQLYKEYIIFLIKILKKMFT